MAVPPDFTAGQVLTAAQMDAVGMWLVKSQNFTTADPLDLTGIFTSDYRNYKLLMDVRGSSNNQSLDMQFFSGTNTLYNSANYYRYGLSINTSGTVGNMNLNAQTSLAITTLTNGADTQSVIEMTIFAPYIAQETNIAHNSYGRNNGDTFYMQSIVATNTQFTGLRFDAASGSITGSVRIYGLRD